MAHCESRVGVGGSELDCEARHASVVGTDQELAWPSIDELQLAGSVIDGPDAAIEKTNPEAVVNDVFTAECNRMIEATTHSSKLRERATRLVMEIAGLDRTAAERLLAQAGGSASEALRLLQKP